jgi:hypothetical protein
MLKRQKMGEESKNDRHKQQRRLTHLLSNEE